jgi:hypothetical protein
MSEIEILDSAFHSNGEGEPFTVALVDDTNDGKVKLVIMFEDEGYTAVLDLDTLIDEENISARHHHQLTAKLDRKLRDQLDEG